MRADYEGRFRGATKLKGIKDFAAKDYGLVPIRLDTWGQFVFILADPSRCARLIGLSMSFPCGATIQRHVMKKFHVTRGRGDSSQVRIA